jgi:hypothetical protein
MNHMLRAAALACLITTSVGASAEDAEPSPGDIKRAAQAFDIGRQSYKAKDWVVAAEQFEAADGYAPSSAALELAIRARRNAEQLDRAATLSALALERHPDEADLSSLANEILEQARSELHEVTVSCDEPCELVVDNKLVPGRRATRRTLFLAPDAGFTLRASWSGQRTADEAVLTTAGGSSLSEFAAPVEEPADVPPPAPDPVDDPLPFDDDVGRDSGVGERSGGWSPAVFWIGAGLTAVAGGITVWSGVDTMNDPGAERVRDECAGQGDACELYQTGVAKQNRTNVLIGATAGLGVVTILVGALATDWSGGKSSSERSQGERRAASITPWIGLGDGAWVGATGRF